MWIMALAAGILTLFLANSFYTEYMAREIPWNASDAMRDVGKYHVFALAAELYMRDHAADIAYLPTGATVVRWETSGGTIGLKHAKGLPAALTNTVIDSAWRIEIIGGSSYVLCTSMSAAGTVKMANLPQSPLWNPAISWQQRNQSEFNGVNETEMVVFDVDADNAKYCK